MAFDEGPQLERVNRTDNRRWPIVAIALGVVLVALGIPQPWRPETPTPAPVAVVTPDASATPYDPNRLFAQCFAAANWRVTALQLQTQSKVRTAWPVSGGPLPSATPTDAPTLYGGGIDAIGFCTPGFDDDKRSQYVSDVSLWRRSGDGKLSPIDATVIDASLAAQGEVYLAPPAAIAVDGKWPVGDYFFKVRPTGGVANSSAPKERWLPLRIVPKPARKAS